MVIMYVSTKDKLGWNDNCHLPLQEADYFPNKLEFFGVKTAMAQGFRYSTSSKWNSQSDKIVSNSFEVKAFWVLSDMIWYLTV